MSSSIYHRNTELRNVHTKDLYNLAVILDDENYWQTLMEIIPQKINNQTFGTKEDLEKIALGASYERKYNNDHIRLVENAIRRPGESRLCSEILFDEWGSSGRKNERPTLGVLLHLLVQSKLYRAADFVAELLNEPKPSRPTDGPAAEFEFEVDIFKDIQEAVNDTRFYPNTEDLQENVNNDINHDYYIKYHQIVNKKIATTNDNTDDPIATNPPKPPPRLIKSARLLRQQHNQSIQQQKSNQLPPQTANRNNQNMEKYSNQPFPLSTLSANENIPMLSFLPSNNIPKLSALMNTTNCETSTPNNSTVCESILQNLSALGSSSASTTETMSSDGDDSLNSTPSLLYTKPNINEHIGEQQHSIQNSLPLVILSKFQSEDELNSEEADTHDLPAISALNLNGEKSSEQEMGNVPIVASHFMPNRNDIFDECRENKAGDSNLPPSLSENLNCNRSSLMHQLDAIEEDYNGIEHEHELDDDEDSIPNLSFLENRSSNNESSLTSVTNTSGENSFDQSVNDCSSTSTDNVPFLSVLNQ